MSEARKNNLILIEDECGMNLNNTSSPSIILGKDVVFGSHSPSIDGSCGRDYNQLSDKRDGQRNNSKNDRDEPVISLDDLQAKTRYFARLEALSNMEDEHQRRVGEATLRQSLAKKMITKKTHQIFINEIVQNQAKRIIKENIGQSAEASSGEISSQQRISNLERRFREEIVGDAGQVSIVVQPQIIKKMMLPHNEEDHVESLGFEQIVVNTDWTEMIDEAEHLYELPHPIPMKPEICPSFIIENTSRLDENIDAEGSQSPQNKVNNQPTILVDDQEQFELSEQQSQQVSPQPAKQPQRFVNQSSDMSNQDLLQSSSRRREAQIQSSPGDVDEATEGSPPANIIISTNKSISSSDMQQSQQQIAGIGVFRSDSKRFNRYQAGEDEDNYFAQVNQQLERGRTSHGIIRESPGQQSITTNIKYPTTSQLQEYMTNSTAKEQQAKVSLRKSQGDLNLNLQKAVKTEFERKKSARSNRGQSQSHHFQVQPTLQVNYNSRQSVDSKSDVLSNGGVAKNEGGMLITSRSGRNSIQPEVKVDAKLAYALSQISARTFQTILSRRYQNYELAYLITLVAALYEDQIPMNTSQSDLVYKSNWDEISRQLFNAGRVIRSLTKLKYAVSNDLNSEFVKKLNKIQYLKKFEQLQQKFDFGEGFSSALPNAGSQQDQNIVARTDYMAAVKSIYQVLECINDIFDKIMHHTSQQHTRSKVLNPHTSSINGDIDGEISGSVGLNEIEETKSETNSHKAEKPTATKSGGVHHRRTSSIPRQIKPSNRVQAVKIDLNLPSALAQVSQHSRQHALNQYSSGNSSRRQHSSQVQSFSIGQGQHGRNENQSLLPKNMTGTITSLKAITQLSQAVSQKVQSQLSSSRNNQHSMAQQALTSASRINGERNSVVESFSNSDLLSVKTPNLNQAGKQELQPTMLPKKAHHDRSRKQTQFQQSISDFILKEQSNKKQLKPSLHQASNSISNYHSALLQGVKTSSTSTFLKGRPLDNLIVNPSPVNASQQPQIAKTFLKQVQPQQPSLAPQFAYNGPNSSAATMTFGLNNTGQGNTATTTQTSATASILSQSDSKKFVLQSPGKPSPLVVNPSSSQFTKTIKHIQPLSATNQTSSISNQLSQLQQLVHASNPQNMSAQKPPRVSDAVLGSQHEDRMRRQMAVIMKLAEPVRGSGGPSTQSGSTTAAKRQL